MEVLSALFGREGAVLAEQDFQTLLLASLVPPLGTALLSPILDSLIEPLGATPSNIGLMIAVLNAPPIVVIPVAGLLADRYGRKPVLVTGLLLFGCSGTAIAFTSDFRIVLGLRAIQGVGFGGITPIIITSIGDMFRGAEEATAQGMRLTGAAVSQAVFPVVAGVLVLLAWHYPFLLYAITFPIVVLVVLWFDEPVDLDDPDQSVRGRDRGETPGSGFLTLVRQRRVVSLVVARGLPTGVWIAFLTYNSIVVVRIVGGTPAQAGLLVVAGSATSAVSASQAGRITALFDSRYYPILCANTCLGGGFVCFLFAPTLWVAGLGIVVTGTGFGLLLSLYRSIITGLTGEGLRGSVVSLSESVGRVSATATPALMGGAIGVMTPVVGLPGAVQAAGTGIGIVGGLGGIICLLVARWAPSVGATG